MVIFKAQKRSEQLDRRKGSLEIIPGIEFKISICVDYAFVLILTNR